MAGNSRSGAELHDLAGSDRFVVWASRHYLWSAIRGRPVPEFVLDAFDDIGMEYLYYSLDRVLVCLMAAPTEQIFVHDVRCPCLSVQEQALLLALRRVAKDDEHGYSAAMTAIMLPSAARVSASAMKLLSNGLGAIDDRKLAWLAADDECVEQRVDGAGDGRPSRTIN